MMDKNIVVEMAYETIKESLEWLEEYKDNTYPYYIQGVVDMTDNLIRKFK